jgi:hypothetical protein
MLIYEHKRTEEIVFKLIKTEKVVRFITILSCVIICIPIGQIFARILLIKGFGFSEDIIGGFVGAMIGLIIGKYSMLLITVIFEWMAQSLIAQGDIIHHLKKKE